MRSLILSVPMRILMHLAFWGLAYYILVKVFASSSEIQKADHIYTLIFLATVAIGVYINLYLLIPRLLNRGSYVVYGFSFLACMTGTTWLNQVTFAHAIDFILPGYYFISYYDFGDLLKFMAAFFIMTSLLKLSKGYFLLLEARSQLMQLQKERSEAELSALRAQINPHFLFNSLNSIYSQVLKQSPRAPETIMKLSDLLRYILYETRRDRVGLNTELEHMQAYIDLQRIRSGPNATVEVTIKGEPGDREIVPLLFLPLIENSFKHGIKGETGPVYVFLEWIIETGTVRFTAVNNKGCTDDFPGESRGGIGLENLRKRLEGAYPGKHRLEITATDDRFKVELTIMTGHEA